MKNVCLIPVLPNHTKLANLDIALVDGYPLVFYVVKACKAAGIFDEIYVSAEDDLIASMAKMLEVPFHKRSSSRGGSECELRNHAWSCERSPCKHRDHALFDFLDGRPACKLTVVNSTAALLRAETIRRFTETLATDREHLVASLPTHLVASTDPGSTQPPYMLSQTLAGWNSETFLRSYENAEEAARVHSQTATFDADAIEGLTGASKESVSLIESALLHRRMKIVTGSHEFSTDVVGIEHELESLIGKDGVSKFVDDGANAQVCNIEEIKARMGQAPWLYLLIYSGRDQTGLICQLPGEGSRKHCHVTHDEWWVVLQGNFEWRLANGDVVTAGKLDVVYLPRGTVHQIFCTGDGPGIRLAVGARDMDHVYVK